MALSGTLKDFGIADILQLIGQQSKTGVLYVQSRTMEVEVSFVGGNVARAVSRTRRSRDLLGAMLVRRGLVSEAELEVALEVQARTLKRLGDILVAEGKVASEQLRQMMRLQTTETLYELFTWKNGTYEFVQQDVEFDAGQADALRPEAVLMEGFRRLDEWPLVRKVIGSTDLAFERLKPLPEAEPGRTPLPPDTGFEDAFGDPADAGGGLPRNIGRHELLMYRLAEPGYTVQRLCDLSGLGEFESCKALANLVTEGYLRTVSARRIARWEGGPLVPGLGLLVRRGVLQTVLGLLVVGLLVVAARVVGVGTIASTAVVPADAAGPVRALARARMSRVMSAIDVYRLRHGAYPSSLDEVVADGLLAGRELKYPYERPFHYRRTADGYLLLPPVNLPAPGGHEPFLLFSSKQ